MLNKDFELLIDCKASYFFPNQPSQVAVKVCTTLDGYEIPADIRIIDWLQTLPPGNAQLSLRLLCRMQSAMEPSSDVDIDGDLSYFSFHQQHSLKRMRSSPEADYQQNCKRPRSNFESNIQHISKLTQENGSLYGSQIMVQNSHGLLYDNQSMLPGSNIVIHESQKSQTRGKFQENQTGTRGSNDTFHGKQSILTSIDDSFLKPIRSDTKRNHASKMDTQHERSTVSGRKCTSSVDVNQNDDSNKPRVDQSSCPPGVVAPTPPASTPSSEKKKSKKKRRPENEADSSLMKNVASAVSPAATPRAVSSQQADDDGIPSTYPMESNTSVIAFDLMSIPPSKPRFDDDASVPNPENKENDTENQQEEESESESASEEEESTSVEDENASGADTTIVQDELSDTLIATIKPNSEKSQSVSGSSSSENEESSDGGSSAEDSFEDESDAEESENSVETSDEKKVPSAATVNNTAIDTIETKDSKSFEPSVNEERMSPASADPDVTEESESSEISSSEDEEEDSVADPLAEKNGNEPLESSEEDRASVSGEEQALAEKTPVETSSEEEESSSEESEEETHRAVEAKVLKAVPASKINLNASLPQKPKDDMKKKQPKITPSQRRSARLLRSNESSPMKTQNSENAGAAEEEWSDDQDDQSPNPALTQSQPPTSTPLLADTSIRSTLSIPALRDLSFQTSPMLDSNELPSSQPVAPKKANLTDDDDSSSLSSLSDSDEENKAPAKMRIATGKKGKNRSGIFDLVKDLK